MLMEDSVYRQSWFWTDCLRCFLDTQMVCQARDSIYTSGVSKRDLDYMCMFE
jgi:hypothetical protein